MEIARAKLIFLVTEDWYFWSHRLPMARAMGRTSRLFPCPPWALRTAARLVGKGEAAVRLLEDLTVDDEPTRRALGWRPRIALEDGLAATCRAYLSEAG